ncbi:MAG: pilus assembly FimT family protein [Thermoguttaceae bacterium]
MHRFAHRPPGFTLLELVMVTMIIGILSTVAAPRFADSLAAFRVDGAAGQLRSDLAEARLRARITSAAQVVEFDQDADSYRMVGAPDPDHPDQEYQVLLRARFKVAIASVECDGGTELTFNGYGMADRDATIVLECGSHQKTVVVDGDTGVASVQ